MSLKVMDRYDSLFQYYGDKSGIDWRLLKAQAIAESALNPDVISPVGAKGLTQFMDRTWQEWRDGTPGVQEINIDLAKLSPYDPEDAIKAQAAYMAWLMKQFDNNLTDTIAAYNWGIGNMKNFIANNREGKMPRETWAYVDRITNLIKDGAFG
jgi:soluble lytic murein transglycosylase-like protein